MKRNLAAEDLQTSEYILWQGHPMPGIHLQKSDTFMIPFSIVWSGFAFIWETSVILADAPLIFKLWGIPFVVMGFYILIGRFFVRAWQMSETFYVVTSHRVIFYSWKEKRWRIFRMRNGYTI